MTNKLNLEILEKLGKLTREIRKEVSTMPKVGMDITEIITYVEKRIFSSGYLPAFPCTISVNDVAAHYTVFDEGYVLKKGDLIKIDFGISENGFCTDNAITVELETNKYEDLMKANKEALDLVMEKAKLGVSIGELGRTVHSVAEKYGFETIHNLSGHQIGINQLHCGLSVPNYDNGDNREIEDNMQFAIEPFFTRSCKMIKSCGPSNIIQLRGNKPVRDPIAKKLLLHITSHYPHLPFSKRWLLDNVSEDVIGVSTGLSKNKVLYGLKILKLNNIIYEYDALATTDGSFVTQYEDAVVFVDSKKSIVTRVK